MADDWALTPQQIEALLNSPGVRKRVTQLTNQLCDAANAIDPTPANKGKVQNPNFGVYISSAGNRVRGYVHPLGKTGLHVEAGHSVLFKAIATVMGQQ